MMDDYYVIEMAALVMKALGVLDDEVENKIVEVLAGYWEDKLADIWSIDDIRDRLSEQDYTATDDDVRHIFDKLAHLWSKGFVLNWESIDYAINEYEEENPGCFESDVDVEKED